MKRMNTKKEQQQMVNEIADYLYADAISELEKQMGTIKFYRLDNCQAWYGYTENFIVLKSYNTIVAVIDERTGELADVLRTVYGYTATSAKHIAKFRNQFPHTREFTARPL